MSCASEYLVKPGVTWRRVIRWETPPYIYKAITAMPSKAPLRFTVTGHGAVDGWYGAVYGVAAPTEVNARTNPPSRSDYRKLSVIDANTIEINEINAIGLRDYTSGGYLIYKTPVDLTGMTAEMVITPQDGSTEFSLTSAGGDITVDNTAKTITIVIEAADSDAYTWTAADFVLRMTSGTEVIEIAEGVLTIDA